MTSRSRSTFETSNRAGTTGGSSGAGRGRGIRWGRLVLGLVLSLLGLVAILVLALQNPAVATRLVNAVLARAGGPTGSVMGVGEARGSWLAGFEITGFRMMRHDTLVAAVDTLRARYRIVTLMAGRFEVQELTVSGAHLMSATPDTTQRSTGNPPPSLADLLRGRFYAGLPLGIEHLTVRDAGYGGRAGAPDSGLRVTNIGLAAHQVRLGRGFSFQLDTLALRMVPEGGSGPSLDAALSASLADGRLEIRSLTARGGRSRIDGGLLAALDTRDSLSELRLTLAAQPVALEDLTLWAPDMHGSATIDLNLHGPRLDRLSGTVVATAKNVRCGATSFGATRFEVAMRDGRAEPRLTTEFERARIAVGGWIRPFDRTPSYDLELQANRLPARVPGVSGWPALADRADLAVTLGVRGSGYRHAAVDLRGRGEGDVGRIDLDARLDLRSGVAWAVRRLACEDLDVARLVGDTAQSSIRATLSAQGRGIDARSRTLAAALHVEPSRYGAWQIRGAEVRARVTGTDLGAALAIETQAGTLEIDTLTARRDRSGRFRLAARFRDLDLARATGREALSSHLDGSLIAEGRGITALTGEAGANRGPMAALRDGRVTVRAEARLEPSRFRGQTLTRASFRGGLDGGAVDVAGDLQSPAGRIDVDAHARPFDATQTYSLPHARFAAVDLAAWTGTPGLRSSLTGTLRGSAQRSAAPDGPVEWAGALDLERSPVGNLVLDGAELRASAIGGAARLVATLLAAGDTVFATGEARFDDPVPHGRLECSLPFSVLADLTDRDSLATSGELDARVAWSGRSPAEARIEGTVSGRGAIDRARLDSLVASFRFERGTLTLDTLAVASNVASLRGAGRVPLFDSTATAVTDLDLTLSVLDAGPLRKVLRADTLAIGSGTLTAHLEGPRNARTYQVDGGVRSLAWNGVRLLKADASLSGDLDRAWRPARAEGQVSLSRLQLPGVSVNDARVRGWYRAGQARFDLVSAIDELRGVHLVGESRIDSLGGHLTLDTLDVHADSVTWTLARAARCDLSRDRLAVDGFEIASPGGRVTANGVIDRRGNQSFRLDMEGVGLEILLGWLGREDLRGVMAGSLALSGPATAPTGTGSLRARFVTGSGPAGTLGTELAWNGTRLDVGGRFASAGGDSLAWAGHLPLAFSLAPADSAPGSTRSAPMRVLEGDVDVRVAADRFPLSAFSAFTDPRTLGALQGTLDVDARLTGSSRSLEGHGRIDVAGGVAPLPGLGVSYRDLALQAEFRGDRLVVSRAHAASDKGTLDASGDIRFVSVSRVEPALHVVTRRFRFVNTPDLQAVSSTDLDLTGTLTQPVVRGKVSVENTSFTFTQSDLAAGAATEVPLSDDDVRMMEETFGYVKGPSRNLAMAFYEASDLDVTVRLGGNCWIRQRVTPRLSVALTGETRLRKLPHGEAELFGRIEPVPGRGFVEEFARSFDITGGEVLLNGKPADHTIDIQAQYKPPSTSESDQTDVVVNLAVQGTFDKMRLTLSSEPAMSQGDIVNFIATGRSPNNATTSGSQSSLAKDIGLSQVTGFAEAAAQQAIGLDVLTVRFDPIDGATLVSGTYLDPKLYVGFRQPLQYTDTGSPTSTTSARTKYEVEYAIHQWLVVNLQGETSKLRSFIRARHAY